MGYDNDGRMISKSSSVSTEPAVAWVYDSAAGCTHGAGKLCSVSVSDNSYAEAYNYTILGMVKSDIETIGGTPTTARNGLRDRYRLRFRWSRRPGHIPRQHHRPGAGGECWLNAVRYCLALPSL